MREPEQAQRSTLVTCGARSTAPCWAEAVACGSGVMMVVGAGLNTYLVTTRPGVYRDLGEWFAQLSPWELEPARRLWARTFAEHPRLWGALIGIVYEGAVGTLALSGDRRRRSAGLAGVAAFHGGLLAMGLWGWALPVLAGVLPAAAVTARATAPRPSSRGHAPSSCHIRRGCLVYSS